MNVLASLLFALLLQMNLLAQCDSVFVVGIEIPETSAENIIVSINNTSSTHFIYLNLSLEDKLTNQVIAESNCGCLQLYPNQLNVWEIDTSVQFGNWQLYYNLEDIPNPLDVRVNVDLVCADIPWQNAGLQEEQNENELVLYPNPTKGIIHLEDIENKSYSILSAMGEIVMRSYTELGKINLEALQNGIYFLRLEGESKVYKIVKH